MPPTSIEADHRRCVLNAKPLLLSKCPGFHHQDISLIGYLNPISPTWNSEEPHSAVRASFYSYIKDLELLIFQTLFHSDILLDGFEFFVYLRYQAGQQ